LSLFLAHPRDLYTHTHKNNKNAFRRTTTRRTTPRRRRKRPIRFVSVEVRCRLGNGTSSSSISFLLFSKIFLFSKRLKFVRVLTFSPLSLSLSLSLSLPIINYSTRKLKRRSGPLVRFTSSSRSFLSPFFFFSSSSSLLWTFQKLTSSSSSSSFHSLSDFNRGSRFTRRHEALGKAHRGREALYLARVGVLCRFGRDRLGKLGRSFHEGDPNPGGSFFVLFFPHLSEREMCASPREFVFVFSARSSSRERDTHRKPLFSQARAFYGFQIAIENIHSGTFIR
jgi:hypothetical protein